VSLGSATELYQSLCSNFRIELESIAVTGNWRNVTIKTGVGLMVPIHPDVRAWLHRRSPRVEKAPLFPSLAGKSGRRKSGISLRASRTMAKAGI
jgi:hypothetical protein